MTIAPGTMLSDNVRVVRKLGAGATAAVWLADNIALGSQVAVKVLHATRDDEYGRKRFFREAKASAKLDSPHIVRVFDVGAMDDGTLFIVMERLRGRDLRAVIESDGPLDASVVVEIIDQMCRGLQHAHDAGLLHRDIKPANAFIVEVDDRPFVKLLDFGIAKLVEDDALNLTETGAMMGTPYYMSPEQLVTPRDVDHRTDVWSMGVVAYACLTSRLPFLAESVAGLSLAVHNGVYDAATTVNEALPTNVDAFFARAFAVDPEDRFQTAIEFSAALRLSLDCAKPESDPVEPLHRTQNDDGGGLARTGEREPVAATSLTASRAALTGDPTLDTTTEATEAPGRYRGGSPNAGSPQAGSPHAETSSGVGRTVLVAVGAALLVVVGVLAGRVGNGPTVAPTTLPTGADSPTSLNVADTSTAETAAPPATVTSAATSATAPKSSATAPYAPPALSGQAVAPKPSGTRWRRLGVKCGKFEKSQSCAPCCDKPNLKKYPGEKIIMMPYPSCECVFDGWEWDRRRGRASP